MIQEHKELLHRDLCARLPYKVIVDYGHNAFDVRKGHYVRHGSKCILTCDLLDVFMSPRQNEKGEYIIPYLFPLSSMTEEQKKEWHSLMIRDSYGILYHTIDSFDYLYKNHIDFRGLILKGLAKDATGLNIYYLWKFV